MVVGDVITDMQFIGEAEAALFGPPPPGLEYEIANIYIPLGAMVEIQMVDPNTSAVCSVAMTDESQFGVNLHLNEDQQLIVSNPSGETSAIASLIPTAVDCAAPLSA